MKKLICDFIDLFGNSIVIISLILGSFLLLANIYHYISINTNYYNDLTNNGTYISFKENVATVEKKISSIDTDKIVDQRKKMLAKVTEGQFNRCFNSLKETKFYNISSKEDPTHFSIVDTYDYNNEIMGGLQNSCIFLLDYNIRTSIENYGPVSNDYSKTSEYVLIVRSNLINYSNYVKNRLLSNSSYSFVTETTRNSVFNEVGEAFALNLSNYNTLVNSVNTMADWYVSEFGGNQ